VAVAPLVWATKPLPPLPAVAAKTVPFAPAATT